MLFEVTKVTNNVFQTSVHWFNADANKNVMISPRIFCSICSTIYIMLKVCLHTTYLLLPPTYRSERRLCFHRRVPLILDGRGKGAGWPCGGGGEGVWMAWSGGWLARLGGGGWVTWSGEVGGGGCLTTPACPPQHPPPTPTTPNPFHPPPPPQLSPLFRLSPLAQC